MRDGFGLDYYVQQYFPGGIHHPWIISGSIQEWILSSLTLADLHKRSSMMIVWLHSLTMYTLGVVDIQALSHKKAIDEHFIGVITVISSIERTKMAHAHVLFIVTK